MTEIAPGVTLVHGGIKACPTCHHFACICATKAKHAEDCQYRRAVCCPVGIECDHGYDVCPTCDPCTCGAAT